MRRAGIVALVAAGALLLPAQSAMAQPTRCVGLLTGPHNAVEVPRGAACNLVNAQVRGNVTVLEDAALTSFNNEIGGNIDAVKPNTINLFQDTVLGNIDVREGTGFVRMCGETLPNGKINIHGSRASFVLLGSNIFCGAFGGNRYVSAHIRDNVVTSQFEVVGNTYRQETKVNDNTGPAVKAVQSNSSPGVLFCARNAPPFVGGPNAVARREPPPPEGQCF